MMTFRRLLAAVTFKRVLAVLLLGILAEPVTATLRWFGVAALDLWTVLGLWALALSALALAAQAGLIYLALYGLKSALAHGSALLSALLPHASRRGESGARDSTQPLDPIGQGGFEPAGRPEEGGGDESHSECP
jgi:hypothetical protein